ncbi:MAG: Fic family protein [Bacteroidota bacterium]|nr:Fic family protein [Bacteroidota bacterium]
MVPVVTSLDGKILEFVRTHPLRSSKEIHSGISDLASYATIKRSLQALAEKNLIEIIGQGKATKYQASILAEFLAPLDPDIYFQKEIDERVIRPGFNFDLIEHLKKSPSILTASEKQKIDALHATFVEHTKDLSKEEYRKEFERLAIDLSWKSSQIEGNTYTLLETELLLKERETAQGKTRDEATMLLNHKSVLDFILVHPDFTDPLTVARIEDIHSMLVEGPPIGRNIRHRRVGITGTNYKPLDNEYQIREALEALATLINQREHVFEKALLALVLISYIQPFEDGNKRTARILSNAILMNHQYCPVSFRTVDAIEYKKAMLIFYEQNNISAFKRIYMEQYEFAVNTYF